MINLFPLFKSTACYKTVKSDRDNGKLSHAYILITPDKTFMAEYLKLLAQVISCSQDEPCGTCRACKLIKEGNHPDVYVFPKENETLKTEDVGYIIEKTFYRPVESDKKIFLLSNGESMSEITQNKLLKTLEEPPENSIIIIGANSEYPLLNTVKSRVLKLELGGFSNEQIFDVLKEDCPDIDKLKTAIACGDGTVGKAYSLYGDRSLLEITEFVSDMMINMKTSADVLDFATKFNGLKIGVSEFLNVFTLALRDLLVTIEGKEGLVSNVKLNQKIKTASGYNRGAITYIFDVIREAEKRLKYNANQKMLIEWILFSVLEGKYKWR